MDTLRDLLDAIRLGVTERITSPLLGNFIISWSLWNYRLFVTIFSDAPVDQKFNYIDRTLYPNSDAYWAAFLVPVCATIALIYIYPLAARYVYEHRLRVNKDLMERRRRVEDTEPMDLGQARQLRMDLREKEQQWLSRIGILEQENEDLRRTLDSGRPRGHTPSVPSNTPNTPTPIAGTTNTIAAQLGVKSGKELIVATAAQLTFVEGKPKFSRQELLDGMKSATGYYTPSFRANLTKYLEQLISEQVLIETAQHEYALKAAHRSILEAQLSGPARTQDAET